MKKIKNRNFVIVFLLVSVTLSSLLYITGEIQNNFSNIKTNHIYKESSNVVELLSGTYASNDGKKIIVNDDGSILYEGTYLLTSTDSSTGSIITGNIGSNNKPATFYQLNNHAIVSYAILNYVHNNETIYLYDYTIFKLDGTTQSTDNNGAYEVWINNTKKGTYSDLQTAIDNTPNGSTLKIIKDIAIESGAYITGKEITIDGGNHIITRTKWKNAVFVVDNDATLKINNLTIDGGATNFEVDYDAITFNNYVIPLKENSNSNDPIMTDSAVISKGNLVGNNFNVNNNYSNLKGSAITIISGSATLKNSSLNHNYANKQGAALLIGSELKQGETAFNTDKIVLENCELNNNYTLNGNGGAVFAWNFVEMSINNTTFYGNTANSYSSGGGAIYIPGGPDATADTYDLEYPQIYIKDSKFEKNYAGNDGFAISNNSAEMSIDNTVFKKNAGTHPTGSVGTLSFAADIQPEYRVTITNSIFDGNKGAVSCIGDHGTLLNLDIGNTEFKNNEGLYTLLFYSGTAYIKDSTFINDNSDYATIDIRAGYSSERYHEYQPNTVTLKNISFEESKSATDVLVRKNGHNLTLNESTVVLLGETKGNISVWDGALAIVKGTHTGMIHLDKDTPKENITIQEDATLDGKLLENKNTYIVTLEYKENENKYYKYLYLSPDKKYTDKELYLIHSLGKESEKLEYFTDSSYTTHWTYDVSSNTTIYTKWTEHTHTYEKDLVLYDNTLYQQAECGYLGKKVSLQIPNELVYTSKEIPVVVNNELNISNYKITYYVQEDNEWEETSVPINVGTYKAVLTYNELSIETQYTIVEEVKDEVQDSEKTPEQEETTPTDKDKDEENENNETESDSDQEEKNPFTSSSSLQFIVMFLGVIAFVIFIIANKRMKISKF